MKLSVNWLRYINEKYHTAGEPAPGGVDKLVEKIGAQLGAVEEVVDLGKRYQGIVVVKVVACEKHPNADKLNVCLIDDGGVIKHAKRDGKGHVEVVCGAPNVRAGLTVAWIPPGATVPSTYDKDPFVIEARELRGVVSNGMLASLKELGIGDDHEGILEIEEDVKPGTPLANVYKLDDYIIDIENKMFTHRPDCFGMLGLAREIAGIQGKPFKSPDWYQIDAQILKPSGDLLNLEVKNTIPELIPRLCAVAMSGIEVKVSPVWLQSFLSRVGIRPINSIVDLTNFYMYQTGQPMHAYDYDKLKTGVLGARLSKDGESLRLLGGKVIKLKAGAMVITDGLKPIGLGGVMGGADTEVDNGTKNIVLECATFDMNATRKSAMTYGLFTDAATRFTKGQSPRQNLAALAKIIETIAKPQYSGGQVASQLIDVNATGSKEVSVEVGSEFINERLGLDLSPENIKKLLENVEFTVSLNAKKLRVVVPFWRTDIEIPEDIVEEVGRLYGYDHLPLKLPMRDLTPAKQDSALELKNRVRDILAEAGANEVLTYSFVHGSLIEKAGQDTADAYHIRNALSPDLQYYRQSLTPSLLDKVHANIKLGYDHFALFEIGRAHVKGVLDDEKLPAELQRLGVVLTNRRDPGAGAPFYGIKKLRVHLFERLNIRVECEPMDVDKLPKAWQVAAQAFRPGRTAMLSSGKTIVGLVGEPTAALTRSLKLPAYTAQAELDLAAMQQLASPYNSYRPLNRYPSVEQDFCLKLAAKMPYRQATSFMRAQLKTLAEPQGYQYSLKALDIFQREDDNMHKQITWRIILSHTRRTLTTEETNNLLDELAASAKKELKAERI